MERLLHRRLVDIVSGLRFGEHVLDEIVVPEALLDNLEALQSLLDQIADLHAELLQGRAKSSSVGLELSQCRALGRGGTCLRGVSRVVNLLLHMCRRSGRLHVELRRGDES